MASDPYTNYMQYNYYPSMSRGDIESRMREPSITDNANKYFTESYPDIDPYQPSAEAPPEFEKGTVGKMAANSALKGAGMGASIGSAIPVIGTAVGAGVGAAVGAVAGWLKGSKLKKEAASDAAEFKASEAKEAVASKERDYRMNMQQKQSDYMKTLSTGKLR